MNEWSIRRKRTALIIALTTLIVIIGLPLYFFLYTVPSCTDNKMNGDELGVDCGGSCTTLCTSESLPMITKGDARVLEVATSTYEVVAHIQNPNVNGEVQRAEYSFTLYGASSTVPLKTIHGSAYVPKNTTFVLFEGPFTLEVKPVRATFAWKPDTLAWTRNAKDLPQIDTVTEGIENASTSPRLSVTVKNNAVAPIQHIQLTTLIFDETGTIAAASRTYVDSLSPGAVVPAVFTWPRSFTFTPASITVIPIALPDRTYIR